MKIIDIIKKEFPFGAEWKSVDGKWYDIEPKQFITEIRAKLFKKLTQDVFDGKPKEVRHAYSVRDLSRIMIDNSPL